MPSKFEKQTLAEYLDSIGVHSGDDRGFILYESLFSRTQMEVSRRYLESAPWEHLLKYEVFSVNNATNIYGQQTICIVLKEPEKGETSDEN